MTTAGSGRARSLFSDYVDLGLDLYESLTPPPSGDTDLAEAAVDGNGDARRRGRDLRGEADRVEEPLAPLSHGSCESNHEGRTAQERATERQSARLRAMQLWRSRRGLKKAWR